MDDLFEIHKAFQENPTNGNTTFSPIFCYTEISNLLGNAHNLTNCSQLTKEGINPLNNLQVFYNVLYCLTSILALIGNVGVIIVQSWCYRSPPLQNLKKYLISLAVSDILFGALCVPFMYTDFSLGQWMFPNLLCPMSQYVQLLSVCVNSCTLIIIGIERFSSIIFPLSGFIRQFKSYSCILVALTWMFGIGFAFIPIRFTSVVKMIGLNNTYHYECLNYVGLSDADRRTLKITNFVFTFMLPAVVLIFTYSAIVRNFWTKTSSRPINRNTRNDAKTIRITLIIIILYGICWSPLRLFVLLHEFDLTGHFVEQQYLYLGLHWLAMANSFVNPFVYTFSSQRFRTDLRNMFKKKSTTFDLN